MMEETIVPEVHIMSFECKTVQGAEKISLECIACEFSPSLNCWKNGSCVCSGSEL